MKNDRTKIVNSIEKKSNLRAVARTFTSSFTFARDEKKCDFAKKSKQNDCFNTYQWIYSSDSELNFREHTLIIFSNIIHFSGKVQAINSNSPMSLVPSIKPASQQQQQQPKKQYLNNNNSDDE